MTALTENDKIKLLRLMLTSRFGDLREQSLIRQGKGWFHVSAMGHEALAAAGFLLQPGDYFCGYYRDRPIALARGMDNFDMAMAFFAKRGSASGGRQMPAHYSDKSRGILSIASVVGASLLPATGMAWACQLDNRSHAVLTTVGDAGSRQGDFFEATAFALERKLPIVFLVEDNGIGISTVTRDMHPLALRLLNADLWQRIDGCDVESVYQTLQPALAAARNGGGPQFIWCRTERISSHSSADDHRKYRSEDELNLLAEKDPIERLKLALIRSGSLTESSYAELRDAIEQSVRNDYARAMEEVDPAAADLLHHVTGADARTPALALNLNNNGNGNGTTTRMVDTINATFHAALASSPNFVFFGQDIEDPKGGVFSLTKGLSTRAPQQVFNSPLAESTIIGVAVGMAAYGKRPVFEIQFADYIWPGFNQLVTHLSTLHWRSNGEWSAPAVIYAPYGAYLPGGALWHSQTNESALAHFPGLHIAIPSTPEDAAGLFWTAMHGNTPALILIPKHLMWLPKALPAAVQPVPFGKGILRRRGDAITVVAWGNCTEVVEQACALIDLPDAIECIDLRTVQPLDFDLIAKSVKRTGRLMVVQEDAESCSVGQAIISRICNQADLFQRLLAPPVLISKPDVHIGYHPNLEYAALPDSKAVAAKIRELIATHYRQAPATTTYTAPSASAANLCTANPALGKMQEEMADLPEPEPDTIDIRVPVLGEGITHARVISIIAECGASIQPDDPLCEVETDKALFPIESPHAGKLIEWLIAEEDEVEVGQVIGRLEVPATAHSTSPTPSTPPSHYASPLSASASIKPSQQAAIERLSDGGLPPRIISQLRDVVPAHMTVKAGWQAIRNARAAAKQRLADKAPSPTVMVAWAVVQAMKAHPIFCCTIAPNNSLHHCQRFDFGFAVAMDNDALQTAVIEDASELDGPSFVNAYMDALNAVRSGHSRSKVNVPLILTSMGGFDVRDAQPLVVPPAIATLFLGEAHWEAAAPDTFIQSVALCLSFDHRWLNGAAGAAFLHSVKTNMEAFTPEELT